MMETPASPPAVVPPVAEDIRRTVRRLRLLAGVFGLAVVVVAAAAAAGLAVRAANPVAGSIGPLVLAGVMAVVALAGGAIVLELTARRAKKAEKFVAAAGWYQRGCLIAGGANLAAAAVGLIVLCVNGISGRLWLPQVLVLAANLLGLLLAVPRVKHLRQFHQRAILPVSRI